MRRRGITPLARPNHSANVVSQTLLWLVVPLHTKESLFSPTKPFAQRPTLLSSFVLREPSEQTVSAR